MGFLANYSLENGTLPHGNTNYGKYHGNPEERCETYDGSRMLTGTGPDTWTHDHTAFGVEGLCGDIYEWMRGMRLMDGKLEIANNNDAAMPIDLSENSSLWLPVEVGEESVYLAVEDGELRFTTEEPEDTDYDGCRWKDVKFDFNLPGSDEESWTVCRGTRNIYLCRHEWRAFADLWGPLGRRFSCRCVQRVPEQPSVHLLQPCWLSLRLLP